MLRSNDPLQIALGKLNLELEKSLLKKASEYHRLITSRGRKQKANELPYLCIHAVLETYFCYCFSFGISW
jgi:hypothetical protein